MGRMTTPSDPVRLIGVDAQRLAAVYDRLVTVRYCYPNLAAGIDVVSDAAPWTYGAYATLIPATTITEDFQVVAVVIESSSVAAGIFQFGVYSGATDAPEEEFRFAVSGGFFGNSYRIGSSIIPANSQVRARLAASIGAATLGVSVVYVEHAS